MASDHRTTLAENCEDCGLLSGGRTDPATVLNRLPAALWNRRRPTVESVPALAGGDVVYDDTPFGPIAGDETLQWNLARIMAEERDQFVQAWRQAEAEQLAIGTVEAQDGALISQCPHASGRDLDRLGEQLGVGRPPGFTDCCYWRLVTLMLFQPGATRWKLVEIAELFTGIRPAAVEELKLITLVWPDGQPEVSFEDLGHYDTDGYLGGATAAGDDLEGFCDYDSFWQPSVTGQAGFGLCLALDRAKPAGTAIRFINEPPNGVSGCKGSTTRTAAETIRGHW